MTMKRRVISTYKYLSMVSLKDKFVLCIRYDCSPIYVA